MVTLFSPRYIRFFLALLVFLSLMQTLPSVRYAVLAAFSPSQEVGISACLPQLSGKPYVEFRGSGVVLSASDAVAVRGLGWFCARVDGAAAVRVSGIAHGVGIGLGKKAGDGAQVLVLQKVDGRIKSGVPTLLLSGTRDVSFDRVILLLPEADDVSLLIRLVRVPGLLAVSDLRVEWLAERPVVRWMRYGLITFLGWGLGLLAVSWMKHALSRAGVILAFMLVLVGVLMPGDLRSQAEHWMLASFALPPINSGFAWSDLAHISMFFLLAMVLSLVRPDFRPLQLLFDLLLLAAATEALQLFVEGRQAGFDDIGLDLLGALLGIGAAQMGGPLGETSEC